LKETLKHNNNAFLQDKIDNRNSVIEFLLKKFEDYFKIHLKTIEAMMKEDYNKFFIKYVKKSEKSDIPIEYVVNFKDEFYTKMKTSKMFHTENNIKEIINMLFDLKKDSYNFFDNSINNAEKIPEKKEKESEEIVGSPKKKVKNTFLKKSNKYKKEDIEPKIFQYFLNEVNVKSKMEDKNHNYVFVKIPNYVVDIFPLTDLKRMTISGENVRYKIKKDNTFECKRFELPKDRLIHGIFQEHVIDGNIFLIDISLIN